MTPDIQSASATMTVKAVILPYRGGQCTIRCFVEMYNRGRNSRAEVSRVCYAFYSIATRIRFTRYSHRVWPR